MSTSINNNNYNTEECCIHMQKLVWRATLMVEKWVPLAANENRNKLPKRFVREILNILSKLSKLEDECNTWIYPVAAIHNMMKQELCVVSVEGLVQVLKGFVQVGAGIAGDSQLEDAKTLIQELTLAKKVVPQRMFPGFDEFKVDASRHPLEYTSRELGEGGYGKVLEAKWMGQTIAVKQFPYGQGSLDKEVEAFRWTSHINIMRMIGYIPQMEKRPACLLMELMAVDLGTFINDGTKICEPQGEGGRGGLDTTSVIDLLDLKNPSAPDLSTPDLGICIEILLQIATGMAYLHQKNIVHRDLKPGNILLNKWPSWTSKECFGFTVKISDFGTARPLFVTGNMTHPPTTHSGTRFYMAPEVKSDEAYSKNVDVYSFGKVCYKVCTGRDPSSYAPEVQVVPSQSCPLAMIYLMKRCWDAPEKRPGFSQICDFLTLFKARFLLTPRPSCKGGPMCLLYPGISNELVEELAGLLGRPWLYKEVYSQPGLISCCICYEARQINQVLRVLPDRCLRLAWPLTNTPNRCLRLAWLLTSTPNRCLRQAISIISSLQVFWTCATILFGFLFVIRFLSLWSAVFILACFVWYIRTFGVVFFSDCLWLFLQGFCFLCFLAPSLSLLNILFSKNYEGNCHPLEATFSWWYIFFYPL